MKKYIIIFFMLGVFKSNAQTGLYIPALSAFDNAMTNLMTKYNVPGAQLAITYQGRLVYNRGFGFANVANQDSVYPNNIFRVASISKTITGLACMKLLEKGLLNLDAKVFGTNGILNDAIYQNILDQRVKNITVRMLLHHSAGWNRNISGDPMFNAYFIAQNMGVSSPPSAVDVIRYVIANQNLDFNPGTQYQYSNFGYCILGRVIEKISGKKYNQFVRDEILTPLQITSMALGKNLQKDRLPFEVSYYDYPGAPMAYSIYDNTTLVPWPYGGFNQEFMDAHGGWACSAEDLLRLVCAFDGFNTRTDILKPALLDSFTKTSSVNTDYACGIIVNKYNNWWHNGSLPGTTSEYVRNGNDQMNWAILLNTRDQKGEINGAVDALVWNVLPSILKNDWPAHDLFNTGNTSNSRNLTNTADVVQVYPNPTNNQINFPEQNRVQLTNLSGKIIAEMQNVSSIDLSNYPSGIYLLAIINKKGEVTMRKKIVKK